MAQRLTRSALSSNALAPFVARRLLWGVVVLWGAITLMFVVFFLLPGDRVDAVIGGDRVASQELRDATAQRLGLDEPAIVQYGRYWDRLVHGDLGTSFVTGQSVAEILGDTVPASARLAFWAVAIEVTVGVLIGICAAITKRRLIRLAIVVGTAVLLAVPVFVIGHVLQLSFGVFPFQHGWPDWARLPVQGIGPDSWVLGVIPTGDQWRYLVLPAITLAAVSTAVTSRLMNVSLSAVMRRDYIRGARAKGLSERSVVWRHGVRNAWVPIVTFAGLDLANLFGSAVVTEFIFNWPGVGSEIADALRRLDVPVVLGLTIVLGVVYVIVNIVVDVACGWLDPRVRSNQ